MQIVECDFEGDSLVITVEGAFPIGIARQEHENKDTKHIHQRDLVPNVSSSPRRCTYVVLSAQVDISPQTVNPYKCAGNSGRVELEKAVNASRYPNIDMSLVPALGSVPDLVW